MRINIEWRDISNRMTWFILGFIPTKKPTKKEKVHKIPNQGFMVPTKWFKKLEKWHMNWNF